MVSPIFPYGYFYAFYTLWFSTYITFDSTLIGIIVFTYVYAKVEMDIRYPDSSITAITRFDPSRILIRL